MIQPTARERVNSTLAYCNTGRVPRQLWALPWADIFEKDKLAAIRSAYSDDIVTAPVTYSNLPRTIGDPHEPGRYTDEWGCVFTGIQRGVIGEVKEPRIVTDDWSDAGYVRFPEEVLTFDVPKVNAFCRNTDRFVLQAGCVTLFERMQYIRGTAELFMDIAYQNKGMLGFLEKLHAFNCRVLEAWGNTDVDALAVNDDWGSQISLLIDPKVWVRLFKPLYADYCAIAHKHGKKLFMHSDGNTLAILPHLIEIGVDAANLQIFCIGLDNLRPYKGKITFWGEIDRQWILPGGTAEQVRSAVELVFQTLWSDGGCIAQCEFGAGANPENVETVFRTWDDLTIPRV